MVNKALRIVLYTIFTISLLFVVPFNNIHADTVSASQITYNVYLQDIVDSTNTTLFDKDYIYDVDFNFDKSYLGWVSVQMIITYTVSTGSNSQLTINRALYLNGSNVHTSFVLSSNYNGINGGPFISMSISVNNSNVTPMADLSSLQDIIDLLQDIDDHISIDVITELQNIVANTSLANTYLSTISNMKQFNIPIESYGFITYSLQNYYQYLYSFNDLYYYQFPVYRINTEITLYQIWLNSNKTYDLIFIDNFNTWSQASFLQHYYLDGVTINSFNNTPISQNMNIVHVNFTTNSNSWYYFKSRYTYNIDFIPIYFNESSNKNISTDFAIRFGLTNELLDNIEIIANGTNASSAASSQSDQANSQLQQDSNTLFTQEDSFKQDMNSAMQNIDTTFSLNNFGSSFMTSAQWVRTQYETMTNNTPFASLITFSLLVGLALIVIGKVYK